MERKLFIIRHGKSSWESIVNDFDRPLTERGVKNSYEMAEWLKQAALIPELIYSSTSVRALHTAAIMAKVWEFNDANFFVRNRLYLPDEKDILETIFEADDNFINLAIFGHNPGFTHFANGFMPENLENLPTAGVAVITMELDSWKNFGNSNVKEVFVDYPKKHLGG